MGGRVRNDWVDGSLPERGFEVFMTAYREAGRMPAANALEFIDGAARHVTDRLQDYPDRKNTEGPASENHEQKLLEIMVEQVFQEHS